MRQMLATIGLVVLAALPLRAEAPDAAGRAELARLAELLRLDEIIAVMRQEGLDYGADIAEALFPARADGQWASLVARIHDEERMRRQVMDGLADALEGGDLEPMIAFFSSPLGQEIIALELSARRALLDPAVDEAAGARLEALRRAGDGRLELLRRFIEANDLIENNVAGTLNSDYAFYMGPIGGGAYDEPPDEEEILRDLAASEAEVRRDTEDWLYRFLNMAYSPLSDAELEAYIAFSLTPEGQLLDQALFDAFNAMYDSLSYRLGRAAGVILGSDNL